jgi:heme A synthase
MLVPVLISAPCWSFMNRSSAWCDMFWSSGPAEPFVLEVMFNSAFLFLNRIWPLISFRGRLVPSHRLPRHKLWQLVKKWVMFGSRQTYGVHSCCRPDSTPKLRRQKWPPRIVALPHLWRGERWPWTKQGLSPSSSTPQCSILHSHLLSLFSYITTLFEVALLVLPLSLYKYLLCWYNFLLGLFVIQILFAFSNSVPVQF